MQAGGTKISASRHFKVSLWCVNDWCSRDNLEPIKPSGRPRKIDWDALATDIRKHPDKLLRERAKEFGVIQLVAGYQNDLNCSLVKG